MGRLDVRIVEARNLPDTQWVSKPDPYVKVKLENQSHKTRVMENDLNPKWDEVFKFIVADENTSQLRMELWNSNVVSDEFLGQYVLSLTGLTRGMVRDEWFLLQQCKSNAEIHVRLLAVDFGKDPTPDQQKILQNQTQCVSSPVPGAPVAYPPQVQQQGPAAYAAPPQGGYPPQQGGYPPQQGSYPPQPGGYPPQPGGYPPQQGGYPPQQGGYPPQQGGYPPQQAYPPQGGYPPQPGGYPAQGGYPPPQPGYGYPPQQPGYPPQQYATGYPPQQPGYGY
jgi:hypothetical protein